MDHKQFKTLSRTTAALMLLALFAYSLPESVYPVRAAAGDITRVSVSSSEAQANAYSRDADVSADGRFVVFWSGASNLVAGDTNGAEEIFLRDCQTGETSRISVSSSGAQADNGSYYPAISSDGRFIAFMSDATNLVSGDTNGFTDIFLRDRQTGITTRVSVSSSGTQADNISDSYVSISGDGRYIAFNSDATNLVSGDTNGVADVFVRDSQTGITERISLDTNEVQANDGSFNPSISADGRFVAFSSGATNLVSGDTNGRTDVFVRDRQTDVTTRVSINSSGVEADRGAHDPAISGNGRYVVFSSVATNLLDEEPYGYDHVYVHDLQTGATTLASITSDGYQMVGWSMMPDISSDGRYIAFEFEDRGDGIAFVAIYIHDRLTGITTRVSGPGGGSEDSSFGPAISANGSYVTFSSFNSSLVPNDTNGWNDVFRLELAVVAPTTKTYQSIGTYDGWVIESGENNETGIRIDERASTFFLGDANNDQQYRSILHFGTASLPNNAIITRVTLEIKRQGIVGDNPFTTHGTILVDVRKPYFDTAVELQATDFQASADHNAVGTMENTPGALWYMATLDPTAFPSINLIGTTQFRLRFALDDNDDNEPDYMKFYSGDAATTDQPVLTIEYFLPSANSPLVVGILRADPDPTSASNVRFTVAFSEAVTGVDATDFTLATTGGISGASISSISGSGDTYMVTVNTGSGHGTIRLDVVDDDSIKDGSNNPLGGVGGGNGSFVGGETYTITKPNVSVYIGKELKGEYLLAQNVSTQQSYVNTNDGPVKITNTNEDSIVASERVIYNVNNVPTSFTEMMALPNGHLDNTYWMPWYNNVDLDTQLRFGNVSGSPAEVHVWIGMQEMTTGCNPSNVPYPYVLAVGASLRVSCPGVNNGPVKIVSNVNIVAAERVIYKVNGLPTSFTEMMGLPDSQLDNTYWMPWNNNVDLDTQLRFGNVSNTPAEVHVWIGGQEKTSGCISTPANVPYPYILAVGASLRISCPGVNNGPVQIISNVNIVAAERVIYNVNGLPTSFTEMMGLPDGQLDNTYWMPWYNNVNLDTQLRFGNVSETNATATVHLYIGEQEMTSGCTPSNSPYTLAAGASLRVSCVGVNSGPVRIESDQNIVAAERVIYNVNNLPTSFSEMMALPNGQLNAIYWLPWYNNVDLDTQLRFGVP
jgi:WD40-like Beta Propeller Repeat